MFHRDLNYCHSGCTTVIIINTGKKAEVLQEVKENGRQMKQRAKNRGVTENVFYSIVTQ